MESSCRSAIYDISCSGFEDLTVRAKWTAGEACKRPPADSDRPCIDIARQLHAVEKAIAGARKTLIQDHLDHCIEEVVGALARERRPSIGSGAGGVATRSRSLIDPSY